MIDEFQGSRKYSKELIALLKQHETIDNYRILEKLGIEPKDSDLVRGISSELEALENYNLITSTPRGWKWIG